MTLVGDLTRENSSFRLMFRTSNGRAEGHGFVLRRESERGIFLYSPTFVTDYNCPSSSRIPAVLNWHLVSSDLLTVYSHLLLTVAKSSCNWTVSNVLAYNNENQQCTIYNEFCSLNRERRDLIEEGNTVTWTREAFCNPCKEVNSDWFPRLKKKRF